ncbi:MAG: hypothetical protein L0099_15420 [Acidobacteria bacterium]|nr:hypothetical protein [Acidobacteriota bacterium]
MALEALRVISKVGMGARRVLWLGLAIALPLGAQSAPAPGPESASQPLPEGAATALYRQLRSVGLDPERVYDVRDAALNRSGVHLSFDEGTIAFTRSVEGKITGAFFEGEGEILLIPYDRAERGSLALHTGSPVLTERFTTAYLRFNDSTYEQLLPALRHADGAKEFVARWDPAASNLAEGDALRLLVGFLNAPPPNEGEEAAGAAPGALLHARLSGEKLGTFDVRVDALFAEDVAVTQAVYETGLLYSNIWTSFSSRARPLSGLNRNPDTGYAPEQSLRITGYSIQAQVTPPEHLEAEATVSLLAGEPGRRALLFELSRHLQIRSVTAEGHALEFIQNPALQGSELSRRGNDFVAVVFPKPLQPGHSVQVRFAYGGKVLSEAGGGLLYVGARGTWFPNRGLAMADFELEFRHPAEWTLVATGTRISQTKQGGQVLSRWVSERPLPVAGFNLGRYVGAASSAQNTRVETYAARGVESTFPRSTLMMIPPPQVTGTPRLLPPPADPDPARNAQGVAERAARTIDFLSQRIGPFPYSQLALTQMPGRNSQGWPGLVFLSSYAFLSQEERVQAKLEGSHAIVYENLMQAHETAHQWWGDLILWRSYRDQWVVEALANYCALLELETERPEAFHTMLESYRRDMEHKSESGRAYRAAGPVTLGMRLSSSEFPDAYDVIAYGRGTWLLHMLRHLLGEPMAGSAGRSRAAAAEADQRFFRVLHDLRNRHENKDISARDLLAAFEDALPSSAHFEGRKSLDWFYEEWINGTAVPRFELRAVRFTPRAGRNVATGTIVLKDAPETMVAPLPIYAVTGRGKTVYAGRVFTDGPETGFQLNVPAGTTRLLLDPYKTVLRQP